jgi:YVTN family beta-propeller protein
MNKKLLALVLGMLITISIVAAGSIFFGKSSSDKNGVNLSQQNINVISPANFMQNNKHPELSLSHPPEFKDSKLNPGYSGACCSFSVGSRPDFPVWDPLSGNIYIPHRDSNNITVFNGTNNQFITSIKVGSEPEQIAFDYKNGYLYITNFGGSNVSVINGITNSVVGSITVGTYPFGIVYDLSNGYIYVANTGSSNVSVISPSTNNIITSVNVGSRPMAETYAVNGNYIYVANVGSNNVSIISGNTNNVITSVNVGSYIGTYGFQLSYDYSNKYVYVVNTASNNVTVISTSTNSVVATVAVGETPEGIAYIPDEVNFSELVVNSGSDSLSEINGTTNTVVGNLSAPCDPNAITYDGSTGNIYVGEWSSGETEVIFHSPQLLSVTFKETGLPSGSVWFVNTSNHYSGPILLSSYTLYLPNGTFSYKAGTMSSNFNVPSASFTIDGSNVVQTISFSSKSSSTSSGLSSIEFYGLIGAVVAVIVIVSAVAMVKKKK